jgi:hypothetical protein
MRRRTMIAAGAALAVAGAGVGIAQAVGGEEESVSGPQADRAAAAAERATGGGRAVEVERDDEGRGGWEVEVRRSDGRVVEVHLTPALRADGIEPDDDAGDREDAGDDAR